MVIKRNGFSLLETLIAIGLIAGLGVSSYKLQDMLSKKTATVKRDNIISAITGDIRYRLRIKDICAASATVSPAFSSIMGNPGQAVYAPNTFYDSNLNQVSGMDNSRVVQITNITLNGANPVNQMAELKISFQRFSQGPNGLMGTENIIRYISFYADIDEATGAFEECLDPSDVLARSIARSICKDLCPTGDATCDGATIDPNNTTGSYAKCTVAVEAAMEQTEADLCNELDIRDGNDCNHLYRFANRNRDCPPGQMAERLGSGGWTCVNKNNYVVGNLSASGASAKGSPPSGPPCTWQPEGTCTERNYAGSTEFGCWTPQCSGICMVKTQKEVFRHNGGTCSTPEGTTRRVECGSKWCSCFKEGTYITMEDGSLLPIENIKVGDKLLGSDGRVNNVLKLKPSYSEGKIYQINGGKFFVTAGHPFMTTDGWKAFDPILAKSINPDLHITQLRIGDTLIKEDKTELVLSINYQIEQTRVFNFELDGSKDYFADGYLVHNK